VNVIRSYLMQMLCSMDWHFMLLDITLCSLHMLFTRATCVIRTLDLCFICGRHEKKSLLGGRGGVSRSRINNKQNALHLVHLSLHQNI